MPIERLNRTEYAAAVKALLGVDVKANEVLPQDIQVEGFDNIAAALSVSPSFLDQYITRRPASCAARVGSPESAGFECEVLHRGQSESLTMPLAARHARRHEVQTQFPCRRRVSHQFDDLAVGLYTSPMENESTLVIMIDGRIVFRKPVGGPARSGSRGSQGRCRPRRDHGALLEDSRAGRGRSARRCRGIYRPFPCGVRRECRKPGAFGGIDAAASRKPTAAWRVWSTASKSPDHSTPQAFRKPPAGTSSSSAIQRQRRSEGDSACARQITESLARRAFRRPVTAEDVNRLMPFYEAGRKDRRNIRSGNRAGRGRRSGQPRLPLSRHSRSPEARLRAPSSLSPIWNWLLGFPSSCGIPARTRNC